MRLALKNRLPPQEHTTRSPQVQCQRRKRNLTTPLILISITLVVGAIGIFSYLLVRQLILEQIHAKALLQVHQRTNALAGKNYISDLFFTSITRVHVVAIATPIRQTYDPASPPEKL